MLKKIKIIKIEKNTEIFKFKFEFINIFKKKLTKQLYLFVSTRSPRGKFYLHNE